MVKILFKFNSDELVLGGSRRALDDLAAYLVKPPVFKKLVIETVIERLDGGNDGFNKILDFVLLGRTCRFIAACGLIGKHKMAT